MLRRARRVRAALGGIGAAAFLSLAAGLLPPAPVAAQGLGCGFVLGFATLRDLAGPANVGECLENQQSNTGNGDAYQRTTGGLLVWRRADNWTAFTDGYRTWLNGPRGVQLRLNVERYTWEADKGAPGTTLLPDTPLFPLPPVTPAQAAPAPAAEAPAAAVRFVTVQGAGRNGTARATVQTTPGASCAIAYVTPAGTRSVAAGLVAKTADTAGQASWSWMIGVATTYGTGSVTVTCDGASATAPIVVG